jgi:thioredoxin-related protein
MKRIILLVFLFACIFPKVKSQETQELVKWYTFEEAITLAKKNPKKLFIDVYTDWCGWCKKMDQSTFTNPVIAEYLNTNFYPVKFNAESTKPIEFEGKTFINEGNGSARSTHQLAVALLQGRLSYPSIVYMNEQLQLLTPVPGYMEPKAIEPIISYFATDSYKTMKWEEFHKTFVGKIK